MGRTKGASSSSGSSSGPGVLGHGGGPGGKRESNAGSCTAADNAQPPAEVKLKEMLRELQSLVKQVQDERARGEHNLGNISLTHERMQQELKTKSTVSPYFKNKLRGLYKTAMQDAESEAELLRKSLDKISEIKAIRDNRNGERPKQIMRRGVLMSMLQQNAATIPLWISKPGECAPALCGAITAESNYICKQGDKVAARVHSEDGEENWILAEVVSYSPATNKYEVDDIDAEEGKESHTLSRRRVVPLPIWKANPDTDPEAILPKDTLVLALYPQTTCFYRALIHQPPKGPQYEYSVLFEDTSYPEGYSPPLTVAQRYIIICKDDKKK